jgi:hypothetical protein
VCLPGLADWRRPFNHPQVTGQYRVQECAGADMAVQQVHIMPQHSCQPLLYGIQLACDNTMHAGFPP